MRNNIYENFYCQSENELISIFNDINTNNITKIGKNKQRIIFDICIQYYRTKAMREIIKKGINNILRVVSLKQDISPEKIAKYALWPLPEETANAASSDNYYIYIINNATNTPLITCDQPVINCTTTYNTSEWEHNLELYYPISPSKAILITKTDTGTEWSAAMVEKFNTKMIDASYMLVFTNSQKRANIISEAQLNNKAIE